MSDIGHSTRRRRRRLSASLLTFSRVNKFCKYNTIQNDWSCAYDTSNIINILTSINVLLPLTEVVQHSLVVCQLSLTNNFKGKRNTNCFVPLITSRNLSFFSSSFNQITHYYTSPFNLLRYTREKHQKRSDKKKRTNSDLIFESIP